MHMEAIMSNSKSYQKFTFDERDINFLDNAENGEFKGFLTHVRLLLQECNEIGMHQSPQNKFSIHPFYCLRDPWTQARLWRQSRSTREIDIAILKLRSEEANFLADVLESVGPSHGRWATNALPGQSWHQWGLAIDCFVINNFGRSVWSTKHLGYTTYAEVAQSLGLVPGLYWKYQDAVHVQSGNGTVRAIYKWVEIDARMKERFTVPN